MPETWMGVDEVAQETLNMLPNLQHVQAVGMEVGHGYDAMDISGWFDGVWYTVRVHRQFRDA